MRKDRFDHRSERARSRHKEILAYLCVIMATLTKNEILFALFMTLGILHMISALLGNNRSRRELRKQTQRRVKTTSLEFHVWVMHNCDIDTESSDTDLYFHKDRPTEKKPLCELYDDFVNEF